MRCRYLTTAASPVVNFNFENTLGFLNDYISSNSTGADGKSYPWLTWNNRPFANQFELANVPYTSPGWLTRLFSIPANLPTNIMPDQVFEAETAYVGAGLTT